MALLAEVLGNGSGDIGALDAHQGRLIAGDRHHHRPGQALFTEVALDELAHLPSPLPNEGDDIDVGQGGTGDHAEEGALAHSRSGEDAQPLAAAAGEESVESANP